MRSDPRDYKLEISSLEPDPTEQRSIGREAGTRPYLRVLFACCGVYQRVYRNRADDAYLAVCPKCARRMRFVVGDGGTDDREFVVR